jgi:hypothetical protein
MGLREGVAKCKRYICASRVSKYPIFVFVQDEKTLISDSTVAILFDDYGRFGVLQSRFHTDWYSYQCSTLEGRLRYTNKTVFETFPFPERISNEVADAMKQIERYRIKACKEYKIGLTTLYNQLHEGGHEMLGKLHRKLDAAVADCYGYPKSKIDSYEQIVKFLIDLNLRRSGQGKTAATGTEAARVRVSQKARTALGKAEKKSTRKQS